MTMTETPQATPPKNRPKKRKAARRKRAVAGPKQGIDLTGMTVTDCPKTCNAQGCVISGIGVCAHPRKGALQGRLMYDNAAIDRLNQAQRMLGRKKLDAQFS